MTATVGQSTFKNTTRTFIDEFLHLVVDKSGKNSDEIIFSRKMLAYNVITLRAGIMMDAFEDNEIDDIYSQMINCIPMEKVDRSECGCTPDSACYWVKSTHPIPKPIGVFSITDELGNQNYNLKRWNSIKWIKDSRVKSNRKRKYYSFKDAGDGEVYLYLYNELFIKNVSLSGVFEDPVLVEQRGDCGAPNIDAICNPLDIDLYIPKHLKDLLMRQMFSTIPAVRALGGLDLLNNDSVDVAPATNSAM